jgi:hypothetical protein
MIYECPLFLGVVDSSSLKISSCYAFGLTYNTWHLYTISDRDLSYKLISVFS